MRRLFSHEIVSYRYFIFSVLLSTIDNRGKNNAELAVQLEIFFENSPRFAFGSTGFFSSSSYLREISYSNSLQHYQTTNPSHQSRSTQLLSVP